MAGAPSHPDERVRVAWLALEPDRTAEDRLDDDPASAVISHRSAARLHGLGDLDADRVDISVPHRRQSRNAEIRFHRRPLLREEWAVLDGLPATTIAVTIGDLAADRTDGGHLAGVVRDAVLGDRAEPGAVAAALRPYAHRYGAPLGDGQLALDRLMEQAGVPEATRRAVGSDPDGQLRRLVQVLARLAVRPAWVPSVGGAPSVLTARDAEVLLAQAGELHDAELRAEIVDTIRGVGVQQALNSARPAAGGSG